MPYVSTQPAWDLSFDVVVIGSGYAGLTAAYEASAWADSVVVLEKMAYTGGNSRIAGGGYCCWDSKLKLREKLGLGQDSWELHAADTLAAGGGFGDEELVKVMCREAPAGLDLLVDAGITFRNSLPRIGGHSAYRSYQMADNGAEVMSKLEAFACQRGNVTIVRKAAVDGIIRCKESGRVLGVSVELAEQGTKVIGANHRVVIATGGYAADVELRSAYKPGLTAAYNCTNHKGATGEVIRFAKEIGADTSHMEFVQLYPCANPKTGGIDQGAFLCFSGTGYGLVYVNQEGKLFVNELDTRERVSDAQISNGEGPSYSILNQRIFDALGIGAQDVERMVRSGRALTADSLDALAREAGFDPQVFTAAIEAHNQAIAQGRDPAFGKPMTQAMIPLEEGPFFAIAQWPSVHYCMGGLRIDPQTHVLDIWGDPIPGLHAAGEVCGGLHGIDRLGGNGIAECVVFGRRAGRAPEQLESL